MAEHCKQPHVWRLAQFHPGCACTTHHPAVLPAGDRAQHLEHPPQAPQEDFVRTRLIVQQLLLLLNPFYGGILRPRASAAMET